VGLASATMIFLLGNLGPDDIFFMFRPAPLADGIVSSAGTYRDRTTDETALYASVGIRNKENQCASVMFEDAEVVIDEHEAPEVRQDFSIGGAIRLRGKVTLADPGWSLETSFDLEQICQVFPKS
jgi:hypothetical protein